MALSANDPSSYSNPDEVVVTFIDLDLDVDFKKHILSGCVHLSLTKIEEGIDTVILDTAFLTIFEVLDKKTSQALTYTLGESEKPFGAKMEIQLPKSSEKQFEITIKYETDPECTALQWLKPSQTAGKKLPYVFSQCQAIHCRSIIPCQDTPSVKCPYAARITAPKELQMLMSAKLLNTEDCTTDPSKKVYFFQQHVPMPSALVAIVGGDIVSRDIGPRSKVWAEPKYVDAAAYEFAETEDMLVIAEKLMGPYVWGQYDLLVLPPSFPYGGMENPTLTFVTPTLLAGDRSLADVIAHEISHSWMGNLVTNNTFEHFWLNEGHTVFAERKICGMLKGGEPYRHFLSAAGWNILRETVKILTHDYDQPEYTKLVPDMEGVDPDDVFSSIPYEKGHALLFYLESLLGGPTVMDPFLKAYVNNFKYKSFDTEEWKEFFLAYFHKEVAEGLLEEVDWEAWLYKEGLPPVKPKFDMSMAQACQTLAGRWLCVEDDDLEQFKYSDIEVLRPHQVMTFIVVLLNKPPLSHKKIQVLGDTYKLFETKNCEILFRWLRVCIKARYEPIIPSALEFVTWQGRMKFVESIYGDLNDWEGEPQKLALKTFEENRDTMHASSVQVVAKAMNIELED